MRSKILIPMMAFVFAIGMSFTTEKPTATVYADDGSNNPIPVSATGCDGDVTEQCSGKIIGEDPVYQLFQDPALEHPLMGGAETATLTRI